MRFSLRRLFTSITLIALGLADIAIIRSSYDVRGWGSGQLVREMPVFFVAILAILLAFLPGPLIGAGIFNLWKRAWIGAILGIPVWIWLVATDTVVLTHH